MQSASKIILIAHHDAAIRDRFAAALADARHDYVTAATAVDAMAAGARRAPALSLALLDLGLGDEGVDVVREVRRAAPAALPILVFAGTVRSSADARALLTVGPAGYINEHAATAQILPALAPHLFPASFDRRLTPRVVISVPVSYRAGQTIAGSVTLNISRGGMAIRTLTPLDPGTEVHVKFRLPSSPADIEMAGRVIWADRRGGVGIQFAGELEQEL